MTKQAIVLADIAHALTRYLNDAGGNIHWINVIGEPTMTRLPTKRITAEDLQAHMFNVIVQNGWSEGTMLLLSEQANRYEPTQQNVLLMIKSLSSPRSIGAEIQAILNWFAEEQWRELLPRAESNRSVCSSMDVRHAQS
jgi:hypothetical protein